MVVRACRAATPLRHVEPRTAGGVVDAGTVAEMRNIGIDIHEALKTHATTDALWKTKNGVYAEQGISLNDLIVVLILSEK